MDIQTTTANGVLTIEFNRPERKNAITGAMYTAMAEALRAADQDSAVRAILITGKPEIFTAGNDLDDFLNNVGEGKMTEDRPVFQFMQALEGCSKPVIAAVAGAAVGIGTTMLMHCDLVYAADTAKFSMPFSQLAFAQGQAAKLVKLPAASIRTTKALMKRSRAALVKETIAVENERFSAMLVGGEAKEAFTAFFEKRKPDFSKFD
jgi:enoyl-CoA hydratase/carnithine racemase